jgi:hypothetical protein
VIKVTDGTNTTKYLNFDKLNAGFTVIPANGGSIATALRLVSANDAPERDPASFLIEGSNDLNTFIKITEGTVPSFSTRFATNTVSFSNSASYLAYRVTFPTVSNASTANSMQVAEVQLLGTRTGVAQSLAFNPHPLSLERAAGGKVTITFSGVLQSATSLNGAWTDVAGQANPVTTKSPYTITPGSAAAFYRAVE